MQRRFFLKAVAALSTVPLIKVPDFRLIEPQGIVLPGEYWFATVRELSAFDPYRETYLFRWDMADDRSQWSVAAEVDSGQALTDARHEAAVRLRDTLRHENIDLRSLRPLPIPRDWKNQTPAFA